MCSSQTTAAAWISLAQPSTCTATFAHPGQSQQYSVKTSSAPSAFEKPVLIVTTGIGRAAPCGLSRIDGVGTFIINDPARPADFAHNRPLPRASQPGDRKRHLHRRDA